MTKQRHIIAIGGGGFSRHGSYAPKNLLMEKYILKQTGRKKQPKVCFIPTASCESAKYILDFHRAFGSLGCATTFFSLFELPTADIESFFLDHDAIYVGGGNTKSLMALWKEWKLDQHLKTAYEHGVVLCGVSAGANCWFEECVTDSIPGDLTAMDCLGFLKGSCCPHYDGEANRRPSFHKLLRENKIGKGIAIDDFVGVHYVNEEIHKVVRSFGSGKAHLVAKVSKEVREKDLESVKLN